jgi:hypothetical protein
MRINKILLKFQKPWKNFQNSPDGVRECQNTSRATLVLRNRIKSIYLGKENFSLGKQA